MKRTTLNFLLILNFLCAATMAFGMDQEKADIIEKQASQIISESLFYNYNGHNSKAYFFNVAGFNEYMDRHDKDTFSESLYNAEHHIATALQEQTRLKMRSKNQETALCYREFARRYLIRNKKMPESHPVAIIDTCKTTAMHFLASSLYGESYENAIHIAKHRWNTCEKPECEKYNWPL